MCPISITIVEPNQLFREGLWQLLDKPPRTVIAAAKSAAEIFDHAEPPLPDLVIWGPGVGRDIEAQMTRVREHCSMTKRIRFVLLADTADAAWVRRAAVSGADAVLSQDISSDVMQRSLDLVMLGQQLFPATLAHSSAESAAPQQADLRLLPIQRDRWAAVATIGQRRGITLSEREAQVLCLLANGASNKAIARELQLSETTIKAHVKGLLRKISASNRTQAAIWALNNKPRILGAAGQVMPLSESDASGRHAVG